MGKKWVDLVGLGSRDFSQEELLASYTSDVSDRLSQMAHEYGQTWLNERDLTTLYLRTLKQTGNEDVALTAINRGLFHNARALQEAVLDEGDMNGAIVAAWIDEAVSNCYPRYDEDKPLKVDVDKEVTDGRGKASIRFKKPVNQGRLA